MNNSSQSKSSATPAPQQSGLMSMADFKRHAYTVFHISNFMPFKQQATQKQIYYIVDNTGPLSLSIMNKPVIANLVAGGDGIAVYNNTDAPFQLALSADINFNTNSACLLVIGDLSANNVVSIDAVPSFQYETVTLNPQQFIAVAAVSANGFGSNDVAVVDIIPMSICPVPPPTSCPPPKKDDVLPMVLLGLLVVAVCAGAYALLNKNSKAGFRRRK